MSMLFNCFYCKTVHKTKEIQAEKILLRWGKTNIMIQYNKGWHKLLLLPMSGSILNSSYSEGQRPLLRLLTQQRQRNT